MDLILTDFLKLGLADSTISFGSVFTYYVTHLCLFIKFIHEFIHGYVVVGQIYNFITTNGCQFSFFDLIYPNDRINELSFDTLGASFYDRKDVYFFFKLAYQNAEKHN